ncbi:MAG TPA: flagellar biosynthetic protein FliR [Termitinemataceae bacterium]|uniref:flagellar biosynthetic protein FliR n=1 Tax=Treponema sp. J25 TaxID=2094121 RepID=UPI00104D860F|nr:flagellar biosynthetic protein FliR [Treponema sp. J25]TCW60332.1 flagellar biosynthetic protein FliR [Treponema sp. J25]HOJ99057.1 flagellar biosynthetic protein FliR [Termitinemataceae bacterium]HOM22939.1 flagellar biosynthetic protein FliR [Termitinemataceae bacterium]HPQ00280.1 flagellar biosynthetic protein FliR [Termitinemataceae bacterium]
MLEEILAKAPLFILIATRALALIETAPLLSSDAIPQVAKVALAGFSAFVIFPQAPQLALPSDALNLTFLFMVIGEALIGVILGFFLTIVYSAFASAGQFFSLQMGFGASETYDPLAQIENPLLGQYLNIIGMLTFVSIEGFQQLFQGGLLRSFQTLSVSALVTGREGVFKLLLGGLVNLFIDALVISMPILGTLFLVSLAMGLLSRAAPQINILTEGFPLSITVAYILILVSMPFLIESFAYVINRGFFELESFLAKVGRSI